MLASLMPFLAVSIDIRGRSLSESLKVTPRDGEGPCSLNHCLKWWGSASPLGACIDCTTDQFVDNHIAEAFWFRCRSPKPLSLHHVPKSRSALCSLLPTNRASPTCLQSSRCSAAVVLIFPQARCPWGFHTPEQAPAKSKVVRRVISTILKPLFRLPPHL
jgi:hypothetical protein